MRIDAAHMVHSGVVHEASAIADTACRQAHDKPAVILGEVLGSDTSQRHYLKRQTPDDPSITHITNDVHCLPVFSHPYYDGKPEDELIAYWDKIAVRGWDWPSIDSRIAESRAILNSTRNGEHLQPGTIGGSVGIGDYHDEQPSPRQLIEWGVNDPRRIEQVMREKITNAAFYSDAGWFGCSGIEDADTRYRSVFLSDYANGVQLPLSNAPHIDLRDYISDVNAIVKKQPAAQPDSWTRRMFLKHRPELAIYITFPGAGEGGTTTLKIANLNPQQKALALSPPEIAQLAEHSHKPQAAFENPERFEENGIYVCGCKMLQYSTEIKTTINALSRPHKSTSIV